MYLLYSLKMFTMLRVHFVRKSEVLIFYNLLIFGIFARLQRLNLKYIFLTLKIIWRTIYPYCSIVFPVFCNPFETVSIEQDSKEWAAKFNHLSVENLHEI